MDVTVTSLVPATGAASVHRRGPRQLRPISIQLGLLPQQDGSAVFAFGSQSSLASFLGPVEVRIRDELTDRARLEVLHTPLHAPAALPSTSFAAMLRDALQTHVVMLHRYPRTLMQLSLQTFGVEDEMGRTTAAAAAAKRARSRDPGGSGAGVGARDGVSGRGGALQGGAGESEDDEGGDEEMEDADGPQPNAVPTASRRPPAQPPASSSSSSSSSSVLPPPPPPPTRSQHQPRAPPPLPARSERVPAHHADAAPTAGDMACGVNASTLAVLDAGVDALKATVCAVACAVVPWDVARELRGTPTGRRAGETSTAAGAGGTTGRGLGASVKGERGCRRSVLLLDPTPVEETYASSLHVFAFALSSYVHVVTDRGGAGDDDGDAVGGSGDGATRRVRAQLVMAHSSGRLDWRGGGVGGGGGGEEGERGTDAAATATATDVTWDEAMRACRRAAVRDVYPAMRGALRRKLLARFGGDTVGEKGAGGGARATAKAKPSGTTGRK